LIFFTSSIEAESFVKRFGFSTGVIKNASRHYAKITLADLMPSAAPTCVKASTKQLRYALRDLDSELVLGVGFANHQDAVSFVGLLGFPDVNAVVAEIGPDKHDALIKNILILQQRKM